LYQVSSDQRVASFSAFTIGDDEVNVFVHDRISKITRNVSVSSTGGNSNDESSNPSISADGSFVSFSSSASNLVPEDNNYYTDIFVHSMNTTPYISAIIYPEIVKSGNQITVRAYDLNSVNITALILGQTLNMEKRADGFWYLEYTVPNAPDGIYDVLLTSTDNERHQNQINLNFTVDNTPPEISGKVTPNVVKSWNSISVDALTSSDTISITALILGETFELYRQSNCNWNLYYIIPEIYDGIYSVLLMAIDKAGNQNAISLNFIVDNGLPNVSGSLNPETVKSFDKINITATSDTDTSSITALIFNKTYNLIKTTDGIWNLQYTVPYVHDGNYSILLTATDNACNQGTFSLNFNVLNPIDTIPPIISGTITHAHQLNGVFLVRPWIAIKAFSDPDTASVIASIMGTDYTLRRQEDGSWISSNFSWLREGNYTALLTANDGSGNKATYTINFTVKNIISTINTAVSPAKLRSGDVLTITVNASPEPRTVSASTPSGFVNFEKQIDGSWILRYIVPPMTDGNKKIWIGTHYGIGWTTPYRTTIIDSGTIVRFFVDNSPPTISGSATPDPIRSCDNINIAISCTSRSYFIPDDTAEVNIVVFGNRYSLSKSATWSDWWRHISGTNWNMRINVPPLSDGIYSVLVTATDEVGNVNTKTIYFEVDNTPPSIIANISPDTLRFIDFSGQRRIRITARSSPDTKAVYAYFEGSFSYDLHGRRDWFGNPIYTSGPSHQPLKYIESYWTIEFNIPKIVRVGTHNIKLIAVDYAENEGICHVFYKAVDFLGSITPPNGQPGAVIGGPNGSSSGAEGSSENDRSDYQRDTSGGSSGSGGSNADSTEDPPGQNEPSTPPEHTEIFYTVLLLSLLLALILLLILIMVKIGIFVCIFKTIFFSVLIGFRGLLGKVFIIFSTLLFSLNVFKFMLLLFDIFSVAIDLTSQNTFKAITFKILEFVVGKTKSQALS